ncbi:MAG: AzlD domain-containing protein [Anaerolineae bacterium]|jgi:branched-subunit amino acid transport protein|nr:AzlD domain-containing protein [Anaerolineae bacterium]MBT3714764.1 AzlD domain-containing protein [Anaerolineae bacterium]MBT4309519.1 AzlD domain-containing protein [Anaerolineae bacterium]MBT4457295.1 AzlD domain-containing protein [Anaerolineae bacterium]MBT4842998.1 AzlD domain-containing protein [Anaerolineae bacterium]
MNGFPLWMLFIALALGTFALRYSFIYLFGKVEVPDWLRDALKFVPASVLAALVFPALVYSEGTLDISLNNIRLLAGIGGALVAWRTKNVMWTILVGMILFWVLQAF